MSLSTASKILSPRPRTLSRRGHFAALFAATSTAALACSSSPSDPTGAGATPLRAPATAPSPGTSAERIPQLPGTRTGARFERASFVVPAGNRCSLHPEGDANPNEAIPVTADADGVARFYAARPTQPGAIERLALDCTDLDGHAKTYAVDLRSEDTFAPRPFDNTRAKLEVRPALSGDPLSFTREELIQEGYGLRPDPNADPDGYARWYQAARMPMRMYGGTMRATVATPGVVHSSPVTVRDRSPRTGASPVPLTETARPAYCAAIPGVAPSPGCYWTGALLSGSYVANSKPALTQGYVEAYANVNVPEITPGGFGTALTEMSIWTGLDNVFQSIIWVQTGSAAANTFVNTQYHVPGQTNFAQQQSTSFQPGWNDEVFVEEWYCDSAGNPNLTGGYGCTHMTDVTTGAVWDCSKASSQSCASYPLQAGNQVGQSSEFIVENDGPQLGSTWNWPDFGPITMTSANALLATGATTGATVTPGTDPTVTIDVDPDPTNSVAPFDHVAVSLVSPVSNSPALSPSVNWVVTQAIQPTLPRAPGCTFTGVAQTTSEGAVQISCAGGNPGDTVYTFQQVNGAWQNFYGPVTSNVNVAAAPGATLTFLGCSVNAGWGGYTAADGVPYDVAPVAPGDVGCDQASTQVTIPSPSCTPVACTSGYNCGIIPNECGVEINCGECPASDYCNGGFCTPLSSGSSSGGGKGGGGYGGGRCGDLPC
jgi:hypothetical protein